MAVQNEFNELLHAYALGCLDKTDRDKLIDYLYNGGEFPWQELGEFQNLAALFPSILNMEIPGSQLKDKVARRLYKIKSERTEKTVQPKPEEHEYEPDINPTENDSANSDLTDNEIEKTEEGHIEEETPPQEETYNLETEDSDEEEYREVPDYEVVTARTKEENPEKTYNENHFPRIETINHNIGNSLHHEEENIGNEESMLETEENPFRENMTETSASPDVSLSERQPYSSFRERENLSNRNSKSGIIFFTVLFIIVAAGLIFVYLKISSDVSVYKTSVDKLNQQIKTLSSQVNNNQDLQKLLLTKNVKIVNLTGTGAGKFSYGKLIISFDNSKGYLQLSNVPILPSGDSYILWVILNGKFTFLGSFKPNDKVEYFPFALPELSNQGETRFLVSEESTEAPVKPSNRIILTGTLP